MIPIKANLKTWPRRPNGEPIFRTTSDAIFFAQLAYTEPGVVLDLKAWRDKAHTNLHYLRQRSDPDFDILMEYAVKAQFFRECFMEILRIQDEETKQ